jgi:hypothetical protein
MLGHWHKAKYHVLCSVGIFYFKIQVKSSIVVIELNVLNINQLCSSSLASRSDPFHYAFQHPSAPRLPLSPLYQFPGISNSLSFRRPRLPRLHHKTPDVLLYYDKNNLILGTPGGTVRMKRIIGSGINIIRTGFTFNNIPAGSRGCML